jgi:hypothetical protein
VVRKQLRGWLRNEDMQTTFDRVTGNGIVGNFPEALLREPLTFADVQDTYYLE